MIVGGGEEKEGPVVPCTCIGGLVTGSVLALVCEDYDFHISYSRNFNHNRNKNNNVTIVLEVSCSSLINQIYSGSGTSKFLLLLWDICEYNNNINMSKLELNAEHGANPSCIGLLDYSEGYGIYQREPLRLSQVQQRR